jgi:uncharacterized protein (DUF302 family)
MDVALSITLDQPYAEVVPRVREALAGQGFGVLTEIDMTVTLKQKRGADIEDFIILGACNPELAERALNVDRRVGVSCCRATSPSGRPPTGPARWCS